MRFNVTPFRPDFQSGRGLAAAAFFTLSLALAGTALAQPRPPGAFPDTPPDLRAALGNCPADLLRRAWSEMLPLEAEAVESEVVALCTERAEAIARFLDAHARLNGALALVRAPVPIPAAGPPPANDRVERLRGEVASLRSRIARLEGEPERPETDAALADLRDELSAAEAELARVREPAAPDQAEAAAETVPALEAANGEPTSGDLPPPGADPSMELAALPPPSEDNAATNSAPSSRLVAWRVVHVVRSDGGPWEVRLQAAREEAVPVPTGDDPDAPALAPAVRWVPVLDPPVTLAVGEALPDGLTLLDVAPDGVRLADPDAPGAEPILLPLVAADESEPGALEWDFQVLGGEGQ